MTDNRKKPGVAFWATFVPWGAIAIIVWVTWPRFASVASGVVSFVWRRLQ
jgi:hypothetical protein